MGVDCDKIKLSCDFESIITGESKAVIVAFNQVYFTANCELPVNAGVFEDRVTVDDLRRAGVKDNNVPCYIASVSYGRSFYVCIQTNDTSMDMKLAATAMINTVEAKTRSEYYEKLKRCTITCACVGGDPKSHIQIISGRIDDIIQVITANIELSGENYGYPIMYRCNYLTDNKVAVIKAASEYVKITRTVSRPHSLILSSNCAYVYKWNVSWKTREIEPSGQEKFQTLFYKENDQKKTSGWGDTIRLPANATNIHVRCDDYWWFGKTRCVCDEDLELKDKIEVHITGTTLNPGHRVTYA